MIRSTANRWMLVALLALVSACSVLPSKPPVTLYAPAPEFVARSDESQVAWRLAVARPVASGPVATPRILVRPTPSEIEVYPQAQWSESAPGVVGNALLLALEADGRIATLDRSSAGLARDFELTTELRDFQLELAGGPAAVLRIKAGLISHPEGQLIASHLFETRVPASSQQVGDAVAALSEALARTLSEVSDWAVTQGEAQWRKVEAQRSGAD